VPVAPSPALDPAAEPGRAAPAIAAAAPLAPLAAAARPGAPAGPAPESRRSDAYYEVKGTIFGALIEAIDLSQLARLDSDSAREEIRDIVNEIIAIKTS
jgi:pilus assembly protein CpaF